MAIPISEHARRGERENRRRLGRHRVHQETRLADCMLLCKNIRPELNANWTSSWQSFLRRSKNVWLITPYFTHTLPEPTMHLTSIGSNNYALRRHLEELDGKKYTPIRLIKNGLKLCKVFSWFAFWNWTWSDRACSDAGGLHSTEFSTLCIQLQTNRRDGYRTNEYGDTRYSPVAEMWPAFRSLCLVKVWGLFLIPL